MKLDNISELRKMKQQLLGEVKETSMLQSQAAQEELKQQQEENRAALERPQRSIQEALDEHKEGRQRVLELQQRATQALDKFRDSLSVRFDELSNVAGIVRTSQAILESLRFNEMPMRYSQIPRNYAKTNSWIFEEGKSQFRKWLIESSEPFWISGKAGSGKSTLMKYITDSEQTRKLLKQWAGISGLRYEDQRRRLAIGSHFFWKAGYTMQRSIRGLLQSILYQIFRQ